MRAIYKTSRHAARGARTFDVGVMASLDGIVPGDAKIEDCELDPIRMGETDEPSAEAQVRWVDENGDVRFEHGVTLYEARKLHEFFGMLAHKLDNAEAQRHAGS